MRKKVFILVLVVLIYTLNGVPVYAEEQGNSLTLKEAIKSAFTHSDKLKNDAIEIEKKDILFDNASNLIKYTPVDISYNPGDTNLFKNFYGAQFDKRKAEKQLENDYRQLIIDVNDAYFSVLKNELALEAAKVAYEKSQVNLLQAQSKYKVGMIIDADLKSSEAQVATNKAALKDAEAKLDNAYSKLNKLIGVEVSARPVLVDRPTVEPQDLDIETQVNLALANSLEMWTAEEAARIAEQMKIFEKFYDIGDHNVTQAKNTEQDTRKILRNQIRELCMGIDYLYHKNEQLKQQVGHAEASLKIAETQWKLGLITRDNVLATQNALLQARAGQLEVATAYVVNLNTLKKLTGKLDYTVYK